MSGKPLPPSTNVYALAIYVPQSNFTVLENRATVAVNQSSRATTIKTGSDYLNNKYTLKSATISRTFSRQFQNNSSYKIDGPIEYLAFETSQQSPVSVVVDIADALRRFIGTNPAIAVGASDRVGISIQTGWGNDLVFANGRGGRGGLTTKPDDGQSVLNAMVGARTVVDKGYSWVEVSNGQDVVVGGYGRDIISGEYLTKQGSLDLLYSKFFYGSHNESYGSKFFVGGSDNDLLLGSRDSDFLIGDRFNGFECYLNRSSLESNIPSFFELQKASLLRYQRDEWNSNDNPGQGGALLGTNGKKIPMWRPGCDVIHGFGGDDLIYGDDNADNNLALLANLRKFAVNDESIDWLSSRFGDDFIDGGAGNDQIFAGFGSDAVIGGLGSDFISCGQQIIADGYEPVWGPKVIWGDEYNPSNDKNRTTSPDVFFLGDIFAAPGDIEASQSGISDTSQLRQSISEKMSKFHEEWNKYSKAIKLIPKIGTIVSSLGDAFFAFANFMHKQLPSADRRASSLDVLTVIKDFDPSDQLVVKLLPGDSVEFRRTEQNFTLDKSGKYSDINPLVVDDLGGEGRMMTFTRDAGVTFQRTFLQGYTGEIVKLRQEAAEGGGSWVYFGGADFLGI